MAPDTEGRKAPWLRHVLLWFVFVAILVAGVVTVVVPELSGDQPDEEGAPVEGSETPP